MSTKVLSLKKMLPEVIRERLDTLHVQDYPAAKEYAIKQARLLKKGSNTSTIDLNEDEDEVEEKKKRTRFQDESPEAGNEESQCNEFLAWMGKGPGKGNKGPGGKSKGKGFQENCLHCGVWGHRLNECPKQNTDMEKGKGKWGHAGPWVELPQPRQGQGAMAQRILDTRQGSMGKAG